jgi:hypothetical protein
MTQKNDVFLAINKAGFSPAEFVWKEHDSTYASYAYVSVLEHYPSGHYFVFDNGKAGRKCIFSPGRELWEQTVEPRFPGWDGQLQIVDTWLALLKNEVEAPDLWASISQEKKLVQLASNREADQTPFSEDEKKQIIKGLNEIKTYLLTAQKHSEEQAEFIGRRFDYLEGAIDRLDRQAWLHTTIGVFFTIVVGVGMAPDVSREYFRFAGVTLSRFFKSAPPPLSIP